MPRPVQIFVVLTLAFPVAARRNYNCHPSFCGRSDNRVAVAAFVSDETVRVYAFNKSASLCTISDGTRCDKYSDRHTMRIHGKMYL